MSGELVRAFTEEMNSAPSQSLDFVCGRGATSLKDMRKVSFQTRSPSYLAGLKGAQSIVSCWGGRLDYCHGFSRMRILLSPYSGMRTIVAVTVSTRLPVRPGFPSGLHIDSISISLDSTGIGLWLQFGAGPSVACVACVYLLVVSAMRPNLIVCTSWRN